MPADVFLVAQQRVEVARLVDRRGELLQRRRGPGFRPERRDHLVLGRPRPIGSSFAQARCLVPNSRSRSSRPSSSRISTREARSFSDARLSRRRQPPRRHQVDQQRQIAELDHRHLRDPPHPGDLSPDQRFQRRVERLHHVHPRRQHRFDGSSASAAQPPRGDLDLGQLGHEQRLPTPEAAQGRSENGAVARPRTVCAARVPARLRNVHSTWFDPQGLPANRGKEGLMQELPTIQPGSPRSSLRRRSLRSARRSARSPPSATP